MLKVLDNKVKHVAAPARLSDTPSCVIAKGPITLEMEKILAQQPDGQNMRSARVLKLNVQHPVLKAPQTIYEAGDTERIGFYVTREGRHEC